jgi:hypothetical protein
MSEQHKNHTAPQRKDQPGQRRNEGEGNRTAARQYDQDQQRFVRSGQVEGKAREAERALDNPAERREMERAEMVGRRHTAEEDPAIKRR